MCAIDGVVSVLEKRGASFTVESPAKELRQEWVEEALRETGRESVRERLLPAPVTVWFVILMGLHWRTSYVNLLEKLHGTWWTRERWSPEKPPCSRAVTKALFERSAAEWLPQTEGLVVRGLRVQSIDGSTMKTAETPSNSRRFGRPGSSRGRAAFPQLRIIALVDELAELYHDRREDETTFDEMKTHLCDCATVNRPVVFRSKPPDRVVQELYGMLTAYNAVRKTMCEAARRRDLDPRRVSFTSALERTREATPCGLSPWHWG